MSPMHQRLPQHDLLLYFFSNDTAPTDIYTLSLHDALPISPPTRTPVVVCHLFHVRPDRALNWPATNRASSRTCSSSCGLVQMLMTPPDALPNSADDEPRSTSIRSTSPSSRLVSWPWPSGRVCGIPSTRILIPRTANAERAPKPRIEIR